MLNGNSHCVVGLSGYQADQTVYVGLLESLNEDEYTIEVTIMQAVHDCTLFDDDGFVKVYTELC